jgi:chain length determinant protein EpsF
MTISQIFAILKARWLAVLISFGLVLGAVVGVTLWLPKQYTASATVLIDFKNIDLLTGQNFGGVVPISYMVTQVDVIRSGRVVLRVIEKLGLRENTALRGQWQEEAGGQGTFDSWLMELLRKRLDVRPTKDSGVLDITYTSPDPRFSAAMANAFAEAYMQTNVQLRTEPAQQFSGFFDAQAKAARDAYEEAQVRLSAFQRESGLVATEERYDVETARLQELASQQVVLQAQAADAAGRTAEATSNGTQIQEVLNNALVSQLTADLNRQQVRVEEMSRRLGESHPQLIEARAVVAELRRRIADETRRVTGSVVSNRDVANSRLGAINASVAAQRSKVMQLKQLRDEAAVLEREVESKRLAYQSLLQRQNQVSLESQSDRSNVSLLERASAPFSPSSPRVWLNSAIGLVLASILAVAVGLIREHRDRRLRTLDDVEDVLKIKLLGVVPKVSVASLAREPDMMALVGGSRSSRALLS